MNSEHVWELRTGRCMRWAHVESALLVAVQQHQLQMPPLHVQDCMQWLVNAHEHLRGWMALDSQALPSDHP